MREERRLLTVLFADLVGSTELGSDTDPEVLRRQMTQYFERMKGIAETHGGTVEKFIGDAVMAVFGAPQLHDDDAERAVRCGLEMQAAMSDLNRELGGELALRVGVNTGEAVVRSGDDGQFIVGDPITVAARLQQSADAGDVVVGGLTANLTRAAVEYLDRAPATIKGKQDPIQWFKAIRPKRALPRRVSTMRAPLVGRDPELGQVLESFTRVAEQRQARLVTLVGSAGVGKTRLVEEALQAITARAGPTLLQGRCLPYGRGITYWPIIEMLQADAGIMQEDDRETALDKLDRRLAALKVAAEQGPAVARRLAVVLGLSSADHAMSDVPAERVSAEIAWAMRHYVLGLARANPAVIVIDDLQWAEPAMLELIDHLTLRTAGAPVLWICVARPEFLESHPGWAASRPNAAILVVNPLSSAETSSLISHLLDREKIPLELRERLVGRSEGNPLFCEEFLRMLIDDARLANAQNQPRSGPALSAVRIPETIHALLAARLDSLPESEKRTLQAASVVGERFSDEDVTALRPEIDVSHALDGLLHKGLVLEGSGTGDLAALRFKHLLIRDVAYGSLVKTERAQLHDRFAGYLENVAGDRRTEFAEILVYHANQALGLSKEMRLPVDVIAGRARRALAWTLFTGERARSRNDWSLLAERVSEARLATQASGTGETDPQYLRLRLLEAERLASAAAYDAALLAARQVVELASTDQDWQLTAAAQLFIARIAWRLSFAHSLVDSNMAEAARLFRMAGDQTGELEAQWLIAVSKEAAMNPMATVDNCREVAERAADLADYPRAASWMSFAAKLAVIIGHPEGRDLAGNAQRLVERAGIRTPAMLIGGLALQDAMTGDMERAVDRLKEAIAANADESQDITYTQRYLAALLMMSGRLVEAVPVLDEAITRSETSGERINRTELLSRRGLSAVRQGDLGLAERYVTRAVESLDHDDGSALAESRWALAELRAAQGRDLEAEAAYREALVPAREQFRHSSVTEEIELSFARFLVSRGRGREALPMLDAMEAWLRRFGYRYGLAEIAELRQGGRGLIR